MSSKLNKDKMIDSNNNLDNKTALDVLNTSFDLEYYSEIVQEWEDNYINYTKLKDFINSSFNYQSIISSSQSHSNSNKDNVKRSYSKKLEEFIDLVSHEVKKVYQFFSLLERELYLQINQRINVKKHYQEFNLKEIVNELGKLKQITIINFNLTKFINLNLKVISILVKLVNEVFYDHKEMYYLFQSFIHNEIITTNSDLNYIIQFKIVDEINAVVFHFSEYLIELSRSKYVKIISSHGSHVGHHKRTKVNEVNEVNEYGNNEYSSKHKKLVSSIKDNFKETNIKEIINNEKENENENNNENEICNENNYSNGTLTNSGRFDRSGEIIVDKESSINQHQEKKIYNENLNVYGNIDNNNNHINHNISKIEYDDDKKNNKDKDNSNVLVIKNNKIIKDNKANTGTNNNSNPSNNKIIIDKESEQEEKQMLINIKANLIIKKLDEEIKIILVLVNYIDDNSTKYRTTSNDINNIILNDNNLQLNQLTKLTQTANRSFNFVGQEENITRNILNLSFIENEERKLLDKKIKFNLFLCLFHTFIYMTCVSTPLSAFPMYFFRQEIEVFFSILVFALTPLFSVVGNFLESLLFFKFSYKTNIVLSTITMIISSLLYLAYNFFPYIYFPILSRVLLGVCGIRSNNRKFIIENIPKAISQKASFYFSLSTYLGYCFGFFLSFISGVFNIDYIEKELFTIFTTPQYCILIILLIFLTISSLCLKSNSYLSSLNDVLVEDYDYINEINKENYKRNDYNNNYLEINNEITNKNTVISNNQFIKSGITAKPILTKEEKDVVNELDRKLNKLNKQSNFTSTNFLSKELEMINERERSESLYIAKSFHVLSLAIVNFRSLSEFIIIFAGIFLIEHGWKEIMLWQISLISLSALILIIPIFFFSLDLNSLNIFFLLSCLLTCLCTSFAFLHYNIEFYVMFPIILSLSYYCEMFSSKLFSSIIPYDYKIGKLDSGEYLTIVSGLVRSVSICFFGIVFYYVKDIERTCLFVFLFFSVRLFLNCVAILVKMKYLKVRAICRIMNSINNSLV